VPDHEVAHVHNPGPPAWGADARPFLEVEVLGAPGTVPTFSIPTALALGRDGRRYIVDEGECRVVMVSPAGESTGSFGRRGEGPGEFLDPIDIEALPDGRLIVSDYGALRLTLFTPDGSFERSLPFDGTPGEIVLRSDESFSLSEQERVLFTGERMVSAREGARLIHRLDLQGNREAGFGEVRDFTSMILTTFLNKIFIAGLPGDSLLVNHACFDHLEIWTPDGKLARVVHRNVPFTPREPREDAAPPPPPAGAGGEAVPVPRRDVVLDVLSTGVAVSPDGAFWAVVVALDPTGFPNRSLRPQMESRQRWALDLYAASGEWLARQTMDEEIPFALLEWHEDGLYLLNPDGDATVRRFAVSSSGG